MSDTKNDKRTSKGYSCTPSTHKAIEALRVKKGLKSGGRVLDETFNTKGKSK